MLRKKKESLEWLEFEILQPFPHIRHAVYLRFGGESTGPYTSLNIGGGTQDDPKIIDCNRDIIKNHLGCDTIISAYQVHGTKVCLVPLEQEEVKCDGLITQQFQKGLLIKHADCQATIFYDPKTDSLGVIHCGWRGNVGNIYQETVHQMKLHFRTDPKNLRVGISPSLGPCCAEFINYQQELPEAFLPYQVRPLFFDLWQISRSQLIQAGVLSNQIEIAQVCTVCHHRDYYSYRREHTTGRHGTLAYKAS